MGTAIFERIDFSFVPHHGNAMTIQFEGARVAFAHFGGTGDFVKVSGIAHGIFFSDSNSEAELFFQFGCRHAGSFEMLQSDGFVPLSESTASIIGKEFMVVVDRGGKIEELLQEVLSEL